MTIFITRAAVARHAIHVLADQLALVDKNVAAGKPVEAALGAIQDTKVQAAVAGFIARVATGQPAATEWRLKLLRDLVPNAPEEIDANVLRRLDNCLLAIPDPNVYRCLVREYAGLYPSLPRCGRPDDVRHMHRGPRDHQLCVDVGLAFLRRPERLKFIMTGLSDLAETLDVPELVAAALNQYAIYLADDLSRLSEAELLSIPGMTVDLAARCWDVIQRRASGDVSKPEWTPDPSDVDVFDAATEAAYGKIKYTRGCHNRMMAVLAEIDPADRDARVARLSEKSRLEYVVTGLTDIPDEILGDDDARNALFNHGIRVLADLKEQLDRGDDVPIPNLDLRKAKIINDALQALGEKSRDGDQKGGDAE